jgi:5-methylcytosine-specific restriction protein A
MTVEKFPSELTVEQFKEILRDKEITQQEDVLVLETLYSFEGHQGQLKDVIDFHNNPSLRAFNNMLYVKRIGKKYDIHLEERKSRKYKYWNVLFDGEHVKHGYKWILKPELKTALEELGLTGEQYRKDVNFFPDELSARELRSCYEGMAIPTMVNRYERSPQARQKCLEYWGCQCLVCDFDFEEFYGSLGRDYIHVHHLTPISEIGESYEIDPINDLRPVCPNCHAMLHRETTLLTIEQLREIIQKVHT